MMQPGTDPSASQFMPPAGDGAGVDIVAHVTGCALSAMVVADYPVQVQVLSARTRPIRRAGGRVPCRFELVSFRSLAVPLRPACAAEILRCIAGGGALASGLIRIDAGWPITRTCLKAATLTPCRGPCRRLQILGPRKQRRSAGAGASPQPVNRLPYIYNPARVRIFAAPQFSPTNCAASGAVAPSMATNVGAETGLRSPTCHRVT